MKSKCEDIMDTTRFPIYDILYCDPPWEQGLVKMFQTMMRKQVGYAPDNNINGILTQLGKLADTSKPLIVEYGVKGYERVIERLCREGHTFRHVSVQQQKNSNQYVILFFNDYVPIENMTLKGFEVVTEVVRQLKPKVVFDPFAGIGASAKAFIKEGVHYIGHEMNPARAKRMIEITSKQ